MIQCAQCGTENREQAQHCVSCGAALAPQPPAHRQLSAGDRLLASPVVSVILGALCLVYLLNPTAGVVELIPDNLPIVGNLDEGAVGMILLQMLYNLRGYVSGKRAKRA